LHPKLGITEANSVPFVVPPRAGWMVSCLLLSVLSAPRSELSFTASATQEIVIGVDPVRYGVLHWNHIPQPDQEIHTTVGTKLVFKYSSDHDVSLADSEAGWLNCNAEGFEEQASPEHGGGTAGELANVFVAVVTAVGE
jgi:hypothetical protein